MVYIFPLRPQRPHWALWVCGDKLDSYEIKQNKIRVEMGTDEREDKLVSLALS